MSKTQPPPPELAAVNAALTYARQLIPHDPDNEIELEEIERSMDGKFWLVTVGYWQPKPKSLLDKKLELEAAKSRGIFLRVPSAEVIKVYKVVKIDSQTNRAVSMKLREHE
jgi:hypothetical protein